MAAVYPRLDLIVCRAGAMTLAEVTAWGLPSILVPYPHATDDHQTHNARDLERQGAAIVLPEVDLTPRRLGNLIGGLLSDPERRARMAAAAVAAARPDAARVIADRVLELAEAA
jgi:UDP-N-acetylglucosamine--N-acetylmuramyl-(pentapeptide) pyrophosphoryl-undecaprenol N-acetylglucosamine transferase